MAADPVKVKPCRQRQPGVFQRNPRIPAMPAAGPKQSWVVAKIGRETLISASEFRDEFYSCFQKDRNLANIRISATV
jgi:hypothetical protein